MNALTAALYLKYLKNYRISVHEMLKTTDWATSMIDPAEVVLADIYGYKGNVAVSPATKKAIDAIEGKK